MLITLLAVGKKMPAWVEQGYTEYARRLSGACKLELREIAQVKSGPASVIREREGEKILAAIPAGSLVVALDVTGKSWSTEQAAKALQGWKGSGQNVCLLCGGPEGLSPKCLEKATVRWSLSALTFPHPLVRVIVAEQIYRAESLLNSHPYHRA